MMRAKSNIFWSRKPFGGAEGEAPPARVPS